MSAKKTSNNSVREINNLGSEFRVFTVDTPGFQPIVKLPRQQGHGCPPELWVSSDVTQHELLRLLAIARTKLAATWN